MQVSQIVPDIQAAVRILQVENPKLDLHPEIIAVTVFCFATEQKKISISREWVPRDYNKYAEHIGKIVDFDIWHACIKRLFQIQV